MIAAVVDAGSISEAARRIGLTQSALSHRIREAERLLDTSLFFRENNVLVPTDTGKRLLDTARTVLQAIEDAESDIKYRSDGIERVVRLGIEQLGSYSWLPGFLQRFKAQNPTVGTTVVADVSLDPIAALRTGVIDVAIVSSDQQAGSFRATSLFEDELLAVIPATHPLARKSWLEPQDMVNQTCVVHHEKPEFGYKHESFLAQGSAQCRIIRAGVTEAVMAFVSQEQGIAFLPNWTLSAIQEPHRITTSRLTRKGMHFDWHAVTRDSEQTNSPSANFVEALKEYFSENERPNLTLLA
nr:LysR family transcriptional regulator [Pseudomaricurvus alkylphenolicus]